MYTHYQGLYKCAVTVTDLAVWWETSQELRIYYSCIIVSWIGSGTMIFKGKLIIISIRACELLKTSVSTSRIHVEYLHLVHAIQYVGQSDKVKASL